MKTKRLPVKFRSMVEDKFPNAGPNPNIRGMKEKYYGKDAFTVMCGNFLYYLGDTLIGETAVIWDLAK